MAKKKPSSKSKPSSKKKLMPPATRTRVVDLAAVIREWQLAAAQYEVDGFPDANNADPFGTSATLGLLCNRTRQLEQICEQRGIDLTPLQNLLKVLSGNFVPIAEGEGEIPPGAKLPDKREIVAACEAAREAVDQLADGLRFSDPHYSGPHSKPFVGSPLQVAIYKALDGRALKKQALACEVCGGEGTRLYKPGGIKEMMAGEFVVNKPGLGYYRPDAPPPGLVISSEEPKRN
jgi:hypothetical protein